MQADPSVPPAPPQPAIDAVRQSIRVRYSDVQYAIRFQDAADLANGGFQSGEMLQAMVADDEIEGRRRERQAGRVGKHIRAFAQTVGPLQIEANNK